MRGRRGAVRHQLQGLAIFALTLGASAAALSLLHPAAPSAPTWVETVTVGVANAISTSVRFVAMRTWMFAGFTGQVPGDVADAGEDPRGRGGPRLVADSVAGRVPEGRPQG